MSAEAEHIAARSARIQSALLQVRGRAQTSGGAVMVETDVNGTITDLQISQAAMSVDPGRLAQTIAQCHGTAVERAKDEALKAIEDLQDSPHLSPHQAIHGPHTAPSSDDWEEPTPLRITHSM
ncbi:YbaB/EbfC family nucleoid-associated protein [Nocardia sp. NPDC056000]|uniref:YbaB/EbfC family nucleoid-associated protein n=1 Tax=Nocardia sp. NPDC056000 TaxID=3345674 RepID=UPI0035DED413